MTKAEVFHKPCIKTYVCGDVTVECISNFYGSNGRHPGKWELGCNSSKCWQSMRAFCICIYICGYVYLCVFVSHPGEILPNTTQFACRQLEMINMQSRQRWTIFICISLPAFPQPSFQPPPSRPLLSGIFLGNFMQKQFIMELQKPSSKPGHKSIVSYGCSFCSCPSCTYRPMRCHFVAHKAAVRNVSTLGKIVYNTFVIANILISAVKNIAKSSGNC